MRLLRLILNTLLLTLLTQANTSVGQPGFVQPSFTPPGAQAQRMPAPPAPTMLPQEVTVLFSGATDRGKILLTLNNNHRVALRVVATVYTADGHAALLPSFALQPFESRIIPLSPLLSAIGLGSEPLGFIKFEYNGVVLGLGAQLTLYPGDGTVGVDSPRSLSTDFISSKRQSVFWMPTDGIATFAFTNMKSEPISVHLQCGDAKQEISLGGLTTSVKTFRRAELVSAPSLISLNGYATACEITSQAADVSALRAVGHVENTHNYHSPIRFYDPAAATSKILAAPDIVTAAPTHLVVHNTTAAPLAIRVILRQATLEVPITATTEVEAIAPHGNVQVELGSLMRQLKLQGVQEATLFLESAAPTGAVLAAVTQEVDGLLEDIPLRTANKPRFSAGAYPLRWEQDYTNRVSVTNTSNKALRARALITAGTITYTLPVESIAPGGTKIYDVDRLRAERVKDVNGAVLPLDAFSGKFMWSEAGMGREYGLLGRNSVVSKSNHRRSSFSCGFDCQWTSDRYPLFDSGVGPVRYLPYGSSFSENIYEVVGTAGPYYTYPVSYSSIGLSTNDSNALAVSQSSYSSSAYTATAVGAGSTYVSYIYRSQYPYPDPIFYDCQYPPFSEEQVGGDGGGDPTVSITNGQDNLVTDYVNTFVFTAVGAPSGGSYSWSSSNSNVNLTNTTSDQAEANPTSGGSAVLTVAYTLNGRTTYASKSVNIFQPNHISVDFDVTGSYSCSTGTAQHREIGYTILSDSTTIPWGIRFREDLPQNLTDSCGRHVQTTNSLTGVSTYDVIPQNGYQFRDELSDCPTTSAPVCGFSVGSQTWQQVTKAGAYSSIGTVGSLDVSTSQILVHGTTQSTIFTVY